MPNGGTCRHYDYMTTIEIPEVYLIYMMHELSSTVYIMKATIRKKFSELPSPEADLILKEQHTINN